MSGEWDVLVEIGALAGSSADSRTSAQEGLAALRRVIPYAAASVCAWNPVTKSHETLANDSYPPHVIDHLNNWFVEHDAVFHHMRQMDHRPLRWRDMPFPYRQMYSAQEVFMPAGFDEGVTTCLYTRDGRYTGNLHVSVDDRRQPTDTAMPVLEAAQHLFGALTDGLRTAASIADGIALDSPAAIVLPDGDVLPLPGRSSAGMFDLWASLAERVAAARRAGDLPRRFCWRDPHGRWRRLEARVMDAGAVVAEVDDPLPGDLTDREIQVLTLLVMGLPNAEIGRRLFVSTKTVAKHVEHILEKLGCASRTAAAVRASQAGLCQLPT